MKKTIIVLLLFATSLCNAQEWSDDISGIDSLYCDGMNASIYDMLNVEDTVLYIGGAMTWANNDIVKGFAIYDKDTIYGVCPFFPSGVKNIALYHDYIYLGGWFSSVCGDFDMQYLVTYKDLEIQRFDTIHIGSRVHDICIYNDTMFICGFFNNSYFGMPGYCILGYDGEDPIYIGELGPECYALEVLNEELYAGGQFGVKKYLGGQSWEFLPVQPNDFVFNLKADTINNLLFIGGQFTQAGGQTSVGTCIWDGFNMIATGNNNGNTVWNNASEIYRGEYYNGSAAVFHENENHYEMFVRKWNGESWDSIGGNFNSSILSMEVFRDTLYIGGNFSLWGGESPNPTHRNTGLVKLYMPDNGCDYLKPRINTYADTFYLNGGVVDVNLYNNNPYVDSWEWDFGTSTGSVTASQAVEHIYTEIGEYNVQVTVTDGECVKTANKTIYIELGNEVPQFEQIDMQVHPNPSSNDFTVKVSLPNYNNAEIKIAGLNGHLRCVIPVTGETTIIPTKGWKAGVYVCNLFVDGKLVKVEKLVFE